jgi:hypothetical protein
MMRTPMRRSLCVALLAAASLAVVACGDSGQASGAGGTSGGAGGSGGSAGVAGGGAPDGGGGAAGTSGRGGDAAGFGGGSGAAGSDDCADFSHAEPLRAPLRDLQVVGTGFEAYEGDTVRLVITDGEPHYGLVETTIANGAYGFFLPGGVGIYTGLGVYVDVGKDDACTAGVDLFWEMTTGAGQGAVKWEISPDLKPSSSTSPCSLNGVFDLTQALPCPRGIDGSASGKNVMGSAPE